MSKPLVTAPECAELLAKRGITGEEVNAVLVKARISGGLFRQSSGEEFLAWARLGNVTVWVRYSERAGEIRLLSAYSHRMEVYLGLNMPSPAKETLCDWRCAACDRALETATVKLGYLGETFEVDFPACPDCGNALIDEATAVEKMAKAEQMLEDK